MFYFDFGQDVVVRVGLGTKKQFKRYTAFSHMDLAPFDARFKAQTIVLEQPNGACEWIKNRRHATRQLNKEELKQFLFQRLASEFVR